MTTFGQLAQRYSGHFQTSFAEDGTFIMECDEGDQHEVWTPLEFPHSFPLQESEMVRLQGLTQKQRKHRITDFYYEGRYIGAMQFPMNGTPENLYFISVWGSDDTGEARFTTYDAALKSLLARNGLPEHLAINQA